jgi:hypothetical protein
MNWELQLAAALGPGDESLLSAAREVRERRESGRYGPALAILWDLLLKARAQGSQERVAFVYVHMGKVYGNWMAHVAFRYFRDALDLAREAGIPQVELVSRHAIAGLYRAWNEPEKALPHLEKSLEVARASSGLWCRRDVLVDLIECLEAVGETRRRRELVELRDRIDAELLESLWGEAPDGVEPAPEEGVAETPRGRRRPAGGGTR